MNKVVNNIKEAIKLCGLKDGMTVSFHHHLRDGDYVLNIVMDIIAEMGFHDITVSASSIHDGHEPLVKHIKNGVVTGLDTNFIGRAVGSAISNGVLPTPVIFRTHGGRSLAIENGEHKIDIAFIAAPACDNMGNINGIDGPSACGSLGYAFADAKYAKKVVAITDNLVEYPLYPVSIDETLVDYIAVIDKIGDPNLIVSGTTKITTDPAKLKIADYAARAAEASGLIKNGFSVQTGAGGISLAAMHFIRKIMERDHIVGSFGMGGITEYFVGLLEDGYFEALLDVQCFDKRAVESIKKNKNHVEISSSRYANVAAKSCAANQLDIVFLGATEIDCDFNVNVHTDSDGYIIGGSGGHSDIAEGAKLTIVVAPLLRDRRPIVLKEVMTVSTPGKTVDVLATERGIAVNPRNKGMKEKLLSAGLPVMDIEELQQICEKTVGIPDNIKRGKQVVGRVLYRDNKEIDTIMNLI